MVDALVAENQVSYAITTGVGKLSDVRIAGDQIRELQVNLVRSHAVGVGEPLSAGRDSRHDAAAREFAFQGTLRRARGGHRHDLRDAESRRHSVVPSQGSVGASGDLAPLAHLALALIGEGECLDEKGDAHSRAPTPCGARRSSRWCSKPKKPSR